MLTLSDVIASGVVPAAVAAVTWWLVRWLRGARDDAAAALPWTIAATAGYLAAEIALRARSMNPAALREAVSELTAPHDAVDWLPAAAVAAMVAGIVIAATNLGRARLAGWAAAVALAAALPWRLLAGSRYLPSQELRDAGFATDAWSLPWAVGVVGAVAAAIVATWIAWQWAPADHLPRLRSALAVVTAVGAAALAGLSGSFSYALSIGAVAASLGGCVAAAWFSRPRTGPGGAAGPAIVVLLGMLLCGVAFSEVALWRAVLVGIAWIAAAGRLPLLDALPPRRSSALRIAACLVPLTIAVGTAAYDFASAIQQTPAEPANPYMSL